MRLPTPEYDISATVYPKLAAEKENGLCVTGYLYRPGPTLLYLVTDWEGTETTRAGFELTDSVEYGAVKNEV